MAVKMQPMGKLERLIQKPERVVVYREYRDDSYIDVMSRLLGHEYKQTLPPPFEIVKITGDKRKKVIIGSASDHVLD